MTWWQAFIGAAVLLAAVVLLLDKVTKPSGKHKSTGRHHRK